MPVQLESCANCGAQIGKLETPMLWNENVVCGVCFKKLAPTPKSPVAATPLLSNILPPPLSANAIDYEDRQRFLKTAPAISSPTKRRSMSPAKLFVIIGVAIAAGIALAVGGHMFLVAAARNARPEFTDEEVALLKSIDDGEADLVRAQIVGDVNWGKIATPALRSLVRFDRLRRSDYESASEQRDKAFWAEFGDRLIAKGANVNECMAEASDRFSFKFLLDHGANVNAPDSLGDTPLCRMAEDLYNDEAGFLISRGADSNAVGNGGNTPMHYAAKSNSIHMIERLLLFGGKINARNSAGQTPLALANLAIQKDAAAFLKTKGATE
jgi:hypothetical protein